MSTKSNKSHLEMSVWPAYQRKTFFLIMNRENNKMTVQENESGVMARLVMSGDGWIQ